MFLHMESKGIGPKTMQALETTPRSQTDVRRQGKDDRITDLTPTEDSDLTKSLPSTGSFGKQKQPAIGTYDKYETGMCTICRVNKVVNFGRP